MMDDLKAILESLIFVSEEPLSIQRLDDLMENVDRQEIRQALSELGAEHANRAGGIVLLEVAGGFQFRTRPQYSAWIKKLLKPSPSRLSRAALETLAIIAYKQPITRADIEQIRGVDCGGVLRMLLEKKLIRVLGRKEIVGRPMLYGSTREFLEVFNLKDLRDLPSPKEIASLGNSDLEAMDGATEIGATDAAYASIPERATDAAGSPQTPDASIPDSRAGDAPEHHQAPTNNAKTPLDTDTFSSPQTDELSQLETTPRPSEVPIHLGHSLKPAAPPANETKTHDTQQSAAEDQGEPDHQEAPYDGKNT